MSSATSASMASSCSSVDAGLGDARAEVLQQVTVVAGTTTIDRAAVSRRSSWHSAGQGRLVETESP